MPNIIPPLLSSTPPPIVDDEEDDEFGDFRAGVDLSFGCDGNGKFFCLVFKRSFITH